MLPWAPGAQSSQTTSGRLCQTRYRAPSPSGAEKLGSLSPAPVLHWLRAVPPSRVEWVPHPRQRAPAVTGEKCLCVLECWVQGTWVYPGDHDGGLSLCCVPGALLPEEEGREQFAQGPTARGWLTAERTQMVSFAGVFFEASCLASGSGRLAPFGTGPGAVSCELLPWGAAVLPTWALQGCVLDTRRGHYEAHARDEVFEVERLRSLPKAHGRRGVERAPGSPDSAACLPCVWGVVRWTLCPPLGECKLGTSQWGTIW